MKFMKRWTTTIAASFDHLIGQVENHEALVSGALREMQEFGGKARIKLVRVERDGQNMKRRLKEVEELDSVWAERALRVHATDQTRALECMRRRKQAQEEAQNLREQIQEHDKLEEQLRKDLNLIQQRIAELTRKKNAFSARECRGKAFQAGSVDELGLVRELDEMFNRWELRLGDYEGMDLSADPLEKQFSAEEEERELKAALQELVQRQ